MTGDGERALSSTVAVLPLNAQCAAQFRAPGKGEAAMPLQFCHPEAPHRKLRLPEWYISNLMLDRALDAIVRRVKNLDREHDIPYLAGYSTDGKTIYIDRHMPSTLKVDGREVNTDRFLILHDEV